MEDVRDLPIDDVGAIEIAVTRDGVVTYDTIGGYGDANPTCNIHALAYRLLTFGRAIDVNRGCVLRIASWNDADDDRRSGHFADDDR